MGTRICIPISNNVIYGLRDPVCVLVQAKVTEEHGSRQNHGGRVSLVLALDVKADVTAAGFENSNITADVAARDETRSTNKSGGNVGKDATIQVGHDQHVELLRSLNGLHRCIVDNHIVHIKSGEGLGDIVESAAEKTIGELHDVGLVDARDLLSVVGKSEA